MPERQFDITISHEGEVEIHVKGIKGKACREVVKLFERLVGEVKAQQNTSEFYEPEEQVRHRVEQRF
jgi:hypothetical protein